ncbi:MAG TPA: protein-tyrosine-phosphatase [Stellaceae bacterium]|nr:protein-tyrosine-phosphatase [Stellaceae bacterium]
MAELHLMPFQLTICGIEELEGHCAEGVTHVLSILDPGWPEPDSLSRFDINRRLRLRFHDVIESHPGWIAPERWDVELLLAFSRDLTMANKVHLLVHCHAGVSRSTAAATLVMAQTCPDRPAAEVLQEVVRLRPRAWPNLRILELGDEILGRRGEIVGAARAHYRRALEREPWLAEAMIDGGRGREIAAAGLP